MSHIIYIYIIHTSGTLRYFFNLFGVVMFISFQITDIILLVFNSRRWWYASDRRWRWYKEGWG